MNLPTHPPRHRAGPGLRLTGRDLAVLDTLHRFGLAREATLHALHFPTVKHQKHVQAVLKRLADHRYIGRRFLPPIHRLNTTFLDYSRPDRTGAVYFLAEDGAALLGVRHNPAPPRVKLAYLHHRLDITDLRACLQLAVQERPELVLATWVDQHEKDKQGRFLLHDQVDLEDPTIGRRRRLPIRPDGCFVLEALATGRQEAFFVEMDEGTESGRKRWHDKVLAYRAYARQGFSQRFDFNGSGFRVLTITRTPSPRGTQARLATLLAATAAALGRKQFWFTTWRQLMPEDRPTRSHLFSSPIWHRAGTTHSTPDQGLILADFLFGRDRPRPRV